MQSLWRFDENSWRAYVSVLSFFFPLKTEEKLSRWGNIQINTKLLARQKPEHLEISYTWGNLRLNYASLNWALSFVCLFVCGLFVCVVHPIASPIAQCPLKRMATIPEGPVSVCICGELEGVSLTQTQSLQGANGLPTPKACSVTATHLALLLCCLILLGTSLCIPVISLHVDLRTKERILNFLTSSHHLRAPSPVPWPTKHGAFMQ